MSTAVAIIPVNGAHAGRSVQPVPACQKSAFHNDYRDEERLRDNRADARSAKMRERKSSRNGTRGSVPSWDGPRLSTAFAAQVIAQTLPSAPSPSAEAAYRRNARAGRPTFDERV